MFMLAFKTKSNIKEKKLKKYELLTVIKPNMDTDEIDKVIEKTEEMIKSFDGVVDNTDKVGRKRLSFEVKGFKDGFYVVQQITLDPSKVADVKRQLTLDENIIRLMIVELSRVAAN